MALLKWSSFFSVGIDEIDIQHKKLIAILNDIYDGVKNEHGQEAITEVLPRLLDYTREHFQTEEKFMQEIGYPDFAEHLESHVALATKVENFCMNQENSKDINQLEVTSFVMDWLKDHIMEEDMRYAKYAVSKKAKML